MSQNRRRPVTLRAYLEETDTEYRLILSVPGLPDNGAFALVIDKTDKEADEARDKRTNTLHCQELVRSYIFHKTLPGLAARYMSAREGELGTSIWNDFCSEIDDPINIDLDRGALYNDFIEWCRENEVVNAP